jgi:hypothetical protein
MCRSEGKKATPQMKRILRMSLQGPEWEEGSASQVAAQFTYQMWLEVREQEEKLQLLDPVIEALISGRDVAHVKTLLKAELSKTFVYLQRVLPLIYARIDALNVPPGEFED